MSIRRRPTARRSWPPAASSSSRRVSLSADAAPSPRAADSRASPAGADAPDTEQPDNRAPHRLPHHRSRPHPPHRPDRAGTPRRAHEADGGSDRSGAARSVGRDEEGRHGPRPVPGDHTGVSFAAVDVPYVDFQGDMGRGHLIVRADAAASTARIFTRLFEMRFPIRRMQGVEAYGGDVYKSLKRRQHLRLQLPPRRADQRPVRAVTARQRPRDRHQPRREPVEGPPLSLLVTHRHTRRPHRRTRQDPQERPRLALFDNEGWIWQNIDVPDYMHFDTGYPSKPSSASRSRSAPRRGVGCPDKAA